MDAASYRAGDVIIAEGEYTSDAYVIERGSVEVYLAGPPARRRRVLHAGEIFGEMALIIEQPRSASVRALEDVEARVIDRDELQVIWQHDPGALLPVLKVLCERVRTLTGLVDELSGRSADFQKTAQDGARS
jgi:CRP-like cAMP-binding protein